jgi:hypothetical protein
MLLGIVAMQLSANCQINPNDAPDAELIREFERHAPPERLLLPGRVERPNETIRNGVSYNGIVVLLVKTDQPLQLVNPAAPPEFGSTEDNVVRDPINHEVSGWKIFAINF